MYGFRECASLNGFVRTAANVRVKKYGSLENTQIPEDVHSRSRPPSENKFLEPKMKT